MFIVEKDNKIILADENRARLESTLEFMPDYVGCEITETERPVESIDGGYVFADTPEYVAAKNAEIALIRAGEYTRLVDPLHCEKIRKTALNEWTDEMETEYVEKVRELTEQIQSENPYIVVESETGSENVQEVPESGSENVQE